MNVREGGGCEVASRMGVRLKDDNAGFIYVLRKR